ncbi:DUF721 domain-containing protein [Kushneria aurantia]|uniref:DUF721 domain-containing protein n=1 Tax=Kushneria aurantia TaxID=504092 RepID=A0ABV6G017_9GAMM|nr:DUF721 domain-containing protein [Kushneria aurantia]
MSIKAKTRRAQPVGQLLQRGGSLTRLVHTAELIERAQRQLQTSLPDELADHLRVGGYRDGRLTLITDRAVWLTWLRFERARLLTLLQSVAGLEKVRELDFRVRPIRPVYIPQPRVRHLPEEAASHLRDCASDTQHDGLRRSLERLASHADDSRDKS